MARRSLIGLVVLTLAVFGVALPGSAARPPSPYAVVQVEVQPKVGTYPYAPYFGDDTSDPHQCGLRYHEYFATAGCGGVDVVAHINVPDDPSLQDGNVWMTARVTATYGCVDSATGKVGKLRKIVRTDLLTPVYNTFELGAHSYTPGADTVIQPGTFLNFDAVSVDCESGFYQMAHGGSTGTPIHLSTTLSNLKVFIQPDGGPVFKHVVDGRWEAVATI